MRTASSNASLPCPTDGSRAALLSMALMFLSPFCTQLGKNIPGRPQFHCLWDLAALEWVTWPSPLQMGQRTLQRCWQSTYECPNCRKRAKGSSCQKTACFWGFFWLDFPSRFLSQTGSGEKVKWDLSMDQGEKGRAGLILGWNSARVTSSPYTFAPLLVITEPPDCYESTHWSQVCDPQASCSTSGANQAWDTPDGFHTLPSSCKHLLCCPGLLFSLLCSLCSPALVSPVVTAASSPVCCHSW